MSRIVRAPEGSAGGAEPSQLPLLRRLVAQMAAGEQCVTDREHLIPVGRYSDPAQYQTEMEIVFGRHPRPLCRASELAKPGSVLAHDRTGLPILVVRSRDGELRAFLNVCRHRGMRLVGEEGVCRKSSLVCPYHDWVYGLDGALVNVPRKEVGFPNLDLESIRLAELPCAEAQGFVWTVTAPELRDRPLDMDANLGAMADDLDWIGLKDHVQFTQAVTEVPANWKMILDGFFEGYHVQRLHKTTLSDFFTDDDVVFDRIGLNIRAAVGRKPVTDIADPDAARDQLRDCLTFTYWLFPSTMLVVSPDYVNAFTFYPDGPEKTLTVDTMLVPHAPRDAAEEDRWRRSFDLIHYNVFEKEDFAVAIGEQAGIHSGANTHFTAGRFEAGLPMVHGLIDDVLTEHGHDPGPLRVRELPA